MAGTWLLMLCLAGIARAGTAGATDGTPRRHLQEDDFANFGNTVLLGPASPSPDVSTRINSKVMSDPTSSPQKGPSRTHTFASYVASLPTQQQDIAEILTNLQILTILNTQDAYALGASPKGALLDIPQQDSEMSPHQAAVYHMSASHTPLEKPQYHSHYLDRDPAPEPAGPPPASPLALLPIHTPPETTGSSEHYLPPTTDLLHSFPSPAHSSSSPAHSPSSPAHSPSNPVHSSSSPAHSPSSPAHSSSSPAHSTSSLAHSPSSPAHSPSSPAHSPSSPAHFPSSPAHSPPSPAHSSSSPAHSFNPSHSIFDSIPGPALPTNTSEGDENAPNSSDPPPGVDLSHIISQLTEDDMAGPTRPSLAQLMALNQYMQWLKQQQLEAEPSEEMILASLLHHHNLQQQQQGDQSFPIPPTETPYIPALHGPFNDPPTPPGPPAFVVSPPGSPEFVVSPPAPFEPSAADDESFLPQDDAAVLLAAVSSGGKNGCLATGECPFLAALIVAATLTTAIAFPMVVPAFGAFGRRRRAALDEGSLVLEYLKQNRAALLTAGVAQVEAEVGRPLDPALLQTLEEGDPHYLLPLLKQTLGGSAPRSPRLLRHICDALVSQEMPSSEATVIMAQHCILLAVAHRL